MAAQRDEADFLQGVRVDSIPDCGMLAGRIGEHEALLVRTGNRVRAIGARCSHLGAPLADGLLIEGEIRCPWHHACFDIETGRAIKAPAFDPQPTWACVVDAGVARVTTIEPRPPMPPPAFPTSGVFVVIGGGAAGFAAALALKTASPSARCILVSEDDHAPYDRTLLTKDYLDGRFGEDRLPIARADLQKLGVDVRLSTAVTRIDRIGKTVLLSSGDVLAYSKLLIATGAEPKRIDVSGSGRDHVTALRSLADCRRILARIGSAREVVILGASFIGLEAAASLVSRGVSVTVVSPDPKPLAKTFGSDLAEAAMQAHRRNGTKFVLGLQVAAIDDGEVRLEDGTRLVADLVVVGIGVTPRTALAEAAGLAVDDGVVVDRHLKTSDPDIYAAGDIARWPDPGAGRPIRVEHWVVAERQGQVAAANMLGQPTPFEDVPFFWTKHFDLSIRYIGHAGMDDRTELDGQPDHRDATVLFHQGSRITAAATMGRDLDSLQREQAMQDEVLRSRAQPR